jgi:ATP dependent DNA ligase domain
VICGEDGIPVFDRLRYGRQPQSEAVLFAFDLLELGGKDLRRTQLEERKGVLAKLVRKASWAVQLNERIAERGDIVFRHACKLGFEGIVTKAALVAIGHRHRSLSPVGLQRSSRQCGRAGWPKFSALILLATNNLAIASTSPLRLTSSWRCWWW